MRDGSKGNADPHLDLKIGLFFVAAALGVAGMLLGRPLLIYAAMVAIGVGLLLRFVRARRPATEAPARDRPDLAEPEDPPRPYDSSE